MAKDPAFLFYTGDFNDGTQDFTNEEVGAYLRLLLFQFSQGHLSMDRIKKKLSPDFERLWPIISMKFKQDSNGLFFNKRLEEEQNKRKAYSDSRRKNLTKDKETPHMASHMGNHMAVHMDSHMENENCISINKRGTEFFGYKTDRVMPEGLSDHEQYRWAITNIEKCHSDYILAHDSQFNTMEDEKKGKWKFFYDQETLEFKYF